MPISWKQFNTIGWLTGILVILFWVNISPAAAKVITPKGVDKDFYSLSTMADREDRGTRIKDMVTVEGIRDNMLIGYGLVVGLNGTGDNLNNSVFTEKGLTEFLGRLGIGTKGANLKTKNVAAVTITASLPPFARHGSRIDVTVSTLGDAKSLEGGVLLATPLLAADGEVYAVAQGAVAIRGFNVTNRSGSTINKSVPTSGTVTSGAIIEKEIAFDLNSMKDITLALRNPDITTAHMVAKTINHTMNKPVASAKDPGTVSVSIPKQYANNVMGLLGKVERMRVYTDQIARIVIDEASGTVVMGKNVKIDTVAIAQGNLLIRINEAPYTIKPDPFALIGTPEADAADKPFIPVEDGDENRMTILEDGATLKDLVAGLNTLGVGPRDLITILETIKAAGAIQAEIITI